MQNPIRYSAASFYNHVQTTPATVWVVQHNLGKTPVVEVLINNSISGNLEKAIPEEVQLITENKIHITFSSVQTGKVRVVA